jgi:hypothetical protein
MWRRRDSCCSVEAQRKMRRSQRLQASRTEDMGAGGRKRRLPLLKAESKTAVASEWITRPSIILMSSLYQRVDLPIEFVRRASKDMVARAIRRRSSHNRVADPLHLGSSPVEHW